MSIRAEPAPARRARVPTTRIVPKHHALVRITHWLNVPLLLGLIVSGLGIYWASPVYLHAPDPVTGSTDYVADLSTWLVRHVPGLKGYATPATWLYDHLGIGTGQLALALRLHWFFVYLFIANGLLYLVGLLAGGGYKALLPRTSDAGGVLAMIRYYAGVVPAKLLRRPWPHPAVTTKYNALQRVSYFSMPVFGTLAILSGWAMHKPTQLRWLERLFVNYDGARIVHFWVMIVFAAFVIPHVILIIVDGWDTFRSMITGWSKRIERSGHGEA